MLPSRMVNFSSCPKSSNHSSVISRASSIAFLTGVTPNCIAKALSMLPWQYINFSSGIHHGASLYLRFFTSLRIKFLSGKNIFFSKTIEELFLSLGKIS